MLWKTEAHFASWLGLCPDNRVSGDKVLRRGTRHVANRAANALRQAANALIRSRSYLGAQYRRLRTKLGAGVSGPGWHANGQVMFTEKSVDLVPIVIT